MVAHRRRRVYTRGGAGGGGARTAVYVWRLVRVGGVCHTYHRRATQTLDASEEHHAVQAGRRPLAALLVEHEKLVQERLKLYLQLGAWEQVVAPKDARSCVYCLASHGHVTAISGVGVFVVRLL